MHPRQAPFAIAILLTPLAAGCRDGEGLPVRDAPRAIAAAAPRPQWIPLADDSIARVDDFVRVSDTLTVLDAGGHRVVHLQVRAGAWREVASFGKRGGGPGEMQRPRALARAYDSLLAVMEEGGRIQLFARDGRFVGAEREPLPCPMFAPTLGYGANGVRFVAGQCAGAGAARDTIFSLLLRARGGDAPYEIIARTPRIALDLSWGSPFGTLRTLTVGRDGIYFGTGLEPCVELLSLDGEQRERRCGLVYERFTAPPPAGVERMHASARQRGDERLVAATRWPHTLPAYLAIVSGQGDSALLLVRPASADSIVVHPPGIAFESKAVRLVAPLHGFVGCTEDSCLWYDRSRHRLALHRPAR